ncbi:hypothetical protein [uncultured Demequina sp.]|uniref:hypothetical protein n=1 Tax=uncultured Demequina sp. TaxID=693499 RepID=UPI0025D79B7E|nr:hypothetical protein [uncultured Demequina sp.]
MTVHRLRSSLMWGWLAVGFGAIVAAAQIATGGFSQALVGLGLGLAIAGLGWALFLRPAVILRADAVEVRNVVRIGSISWGRIAHVDLKWTLELVGDDGARVGSFAVPRSSAPRRRRTEEPAVTPSTSDQIASEIRQRAEAARAGDMPAAGRQAPSISRTTDLTGVAIVLASAAAAVLAFVA